MFFMTKNHLILNLREKSMVFWTLAFPILLATLFYFGIGGVDESAKFDAIPVAVVEEDESEASKAFVEFMKAAEGEMVEPEFDLTKEKAETLMEDQKVEGIFTVAEEGVSLEIAGEGMSESILEVMLEQYDQQILVGEDIQEALIANPEKMAKEVEKREPQEFVSDVSFGGKSVSSVTSYYFALLAMACLYMCFLGETAAKRTQANITEIGKRISVSPVHRMKLILSNGISAYFIALVNISIILAFLIFVVKGIDISAHPYYAALTCMVGCLIGVTFGILIESIGKWSQNIKSAILIGFSMLCAFLAGLMIGSMKDIIEKHVPIINKINPAALIADSCYCICVYDDMERLTMNLVIMSAMSIVFLILAWILTRRVRYDSL